MYSMYVQYTIRWIGYSDTSNRTVSEPRTTGACKFFVVNAVSLWLGDWKHETGKVDTKLRGRKKTREKVSKCYEKPDLAYN